MDWRMVLAGVALGGVSGCAGTEAERRVTPVAPSVSSMESFYRRTLPKELAEGTGNLGQAHVWAAGILMGGGNLRIEGMRIRPSGTAAIFMSDVGNAGSGENTYVVFEQTGRGLKFAGHLNFGAMNCLSPDEKGRARVATYVRQGAGEGTLSVWVLGETDFDMIGSVTIHPGDRGTAEGNLVYNSIFGRSATPDEGVKRAFAVGSQP